MWKLVIERGPAAALWLLAMAAQFSGYNSAAFALALSGLAVFFLVAPGYHHLRTWYNRRAALGAPMSANQIFLLAGIAGTWFFATIAMGAFAWRVAIQGPALAMASPSAPVVAPQENEGPLVWYRGLTMEGGPLSKMNVFSVRIKGSNVSDNAVRLIDARIISSVGGAEMHLEVLAKGDVVSISRIEMIPPGAPIELVAKFGPPDPDHPGMIKGIDAKTFLETWSKFVFQAEDDTRKYKVVFNESSLAAFFPGMAGPHVTKKPEPNPNGG